MEIIWGDRNTFSIGSTHFKALELGLGEHQSTLERFVFQKPRAMIDRYQELVAEIKPLHIFEIGIWRGGSCVFLQKLSGAKLVSVDLSSERLTVLDDYRQAEGLTDKLKAHFGVNQADRVAMRAILEEEFGSEPLDLVIDDASHFLDETRASFNLLFPAMRAGGKYVIEDWSWAHGPLDNDDTEPAFYPNREPLTKLAFELVLACGSAPEIVANVEIDHHLVIVTRGEAELNGEDFDIAACSLARGRGLIR